MSRKANPTTLGLFIVSGFLLGVVGLVLFSSGRLFSKQYRFIIYFDSSLKGLNAGAAVKMRGVKVGSVVDVLIHHNQREDDYFMPVIIEVDERIVRSKTDQQIILSSSLVVNDAIRRGFRGQLDAESLLTGVLYVELAFVTTPTPPVFHQLQPEYLEIPSVHNEIQELLASLGKLNLEGISEKLTSLLTRLDTSVADLDLKRIGSQAARLLDSADRFVSSVDLTNAVAELNLALGDARSILRQLEPRVPGLADGASNTLFEAQSALVELKKGIHNLSDLLEIDAPLRSELSQALTQVSRAAQAIADLAEFLERNPNALLTGRKQNVPRP